MSAEILENKTLFTAQIFKESEYNHTVNFVSKEVFNNMKNAARDELFKKEDVLSAVEWLKEEIEKLYVIKTKKVVMNTELQEMGFDTTINRSRMKIPITSKPLLELIKKAFPDLYLKGENMEEIQKLVLTLDTEIIDAGKTAKVKASTGQKEFSLSVKTKSGTFTHEVKNGSIVVDVATTKEDRRVILTAYKPGWKSDIKEIPMAHEAFIKINFHAQNKEIVKGMQLNEVTPYEVPLLLRKAANSIEQQLIAGQMNK